MIAISAALKSNSSLTDIELQYCRFSNNGVKALADALKSNASLKKIDLRSNGLTEQAKQGLRDAIAGREAGFQLLL